MNIGVNAIDRERIMQGHIINAFIITLFLDILIFFANAIGRLTIGETSADTLIVYAVLAYCVLKIVPEILERFNIRSIVLILAFVIFFAYSLYVNPLLEWNTDTFDTIAISVMGGIFFGVSITDWNLCLEKLLKMARPLAVMMLVSFFIYDGVYNTQWGTGAMGLSYRMLVPAILILYRLMTKMNIIDLILMICLLLIMLLQGSRGPFLSVGVYFVLYIIANYRKYTGKMLVYLSIALTAFIIIVCNIDVFFELMEQIATQNNFDAKIIRWAIEGNLADLNGRDALYEKSMELIKEKFIFGWGLYGERFEIGSYCHNIVLEFMIDFGAIPGILLFGMFLIGVINRIATGSQSQKNVIIMLLGMFIVKLFVSGSFWTETAFFMLISMLINKAQPPKREESITLRGMHRKRRHYKINNAGMGESAVRLALERNTEKIRKTKNHNNEGTKL